MKNNQPSNCVLTTREKEVANALWRYWQLNQSNQKLGLIARVVSQCSSNLRVKLNSTNTRQAIYKAKQLGLLD